MDAEDALRGNARQPGATTLESAERYIPSWEDQMETCDAQTFRGEQLFHVKQTCGSPFHVKQDAVIGPYCCGSRSPDNDSAGWMTSFRSTVQ